MAKTLMNSGLYSEEIFLLLNKKRSQVKGRKNRSKNSSKKGYYSSI